MKAILFKIAIFSLLASSCETFNSNAQYTYNYPDSLSDGFDVGSLDEVNMSTRPIEEAVNKIYSGQYSEVHSMLIYKDGKLVLEEYFNGHDYQWDAPFHHGDFESWDRDMLHCPIQDHFLGVCQNQLTALEHNRDVDSCGPTHF